MIPIVAPVLTAIGGYILTSFILLHNPGLLHKKKNPKFTAKHISHRGGAGENYENTLAAFRHARKLGTHMFELDVHLTKDKKIAVIHDGYLKRLCGVEKSISQMDYADLPLLSSALPVDFDPGKVFVGSDDSEIRRIPLLEELFREFPDVPMNVDLKDGTQELITSVSDLASQYNREEITVWGNFSDRVCQACYKENPKICLLFSTRRVLHLVLLFYSGLLPFFPLKETHLELFFPDIFLKSEGIHGVHMSQFRRLLVWIIGKLLMRKSLFEHLEKRGIPTYLWVLNNEEDFLKSFRLGVSGVMTDYPTLLTDFLKTHPEFA